MDDAPRGPAPADPRRIRRALRQRYLGTALAGAAILIYWAARLLVARWSG